MIFTPKTAYIYTLNSTVKTYTYVEHQHQIPQHTLVQHPSLSTNDRDICNVSHDRYRRFSQKETYTMHMMNDRPQRRCMHFSEVVLLLLFALNILISFLNSSLAFFSWVDFGIKFGSVPSHRYMAVGLCWMFWDCGSAADPLYRCWGALGLHPFTQRSMCK